MWGGGCLEGVERLSSGCGEAIWSVWGSCLEGKAMLFAGCVEAV